MNVPYARLLLCALVLVAACRNEPRQRPDLSDVLPNKEATAQSASAPVSDDPNIKYNQPSAPPPVVGQMGLVAGSGEVAPSGQVCLPITTKGFTNVISMQYTLKWDPAVLSYQAVKDFNLRNFGTNNYGAHRTKEGMLTVVWIDESLKGVTLKEGTPIYKVCFTATGKSGQSSPFRFDNSPTPYEVANVDMNLLTLVPTQGVVKIK